MSKSIFFLDTECYPNYFLVMLKDNEGNTHFLSYQDRASLILTELGN